MPVVMKRDRAAMAEKAAEKSAVRTTAFAIPKVVKGDTYMVIADSQREVEDEFTNLYFTNTAQTNAMLQPPFDPRTLSRQPQLNNTLYQCVEVMEVNIDGTGFEFESVVDDEPVDEGEKQILQSFFEEPYPGQSFVTIRRELRRELESLGWAFLEVLPNLTGDVMGLRNVPSRTCRLVKLDDQVPVTKTVNRNGKDVPITYMDRERRFAMCSGYGRELTYFREYGTTREINKKTGAWESKAAPVAVEDRGGQLLYFTVNEDTETPYGIPRWINQLPSILGSRKAEEQNLEFFDAGGVPPAIIFLKGGALARGMDQTLRLMLSGQTRAHNRVLVASVQSIDGSIDTAGKVDVQVERFGSDSVNDSLYATYDERAEDHVRQGFRLPKLFFGDADGLNFATAYTAYMIAEAQVFQPERTEFDERINRTIVKALGVTKTRFKSKPIGLNNIDAQLAALGLYKDSITPESFVAEINKVTNLNGEFDKDKADLQKQQAQASLDGVHAKNAAVAAGGALNPVGGDPVKQPAVTGSLNRSPQGPSPTVKGASGILQLANAYARLHGLSGAKLMVSKAETERIELEVKSLSTAETPLFDNFLSALAYGQAGKDTLALVREHRHAA